MDRSRIRCSRSCQQLCRMYLPISALSQNFLDIPHAWTLEYLPLPLNCIYSAIYALFDLFFKAFRCAAFSSRVWKRLGFERECDGAAVNGSDSFPSLRSIFSPSSCISVAFRFPLLTRRTRVESGGDEWCRITALALARGGVSMASTVLDRLITCVSNKFVRGGKLDLCAAGGSEMGKTVRGRLHLRVSSEQVFGVSACASKSRRELPYLIRGLWAGIREPMRIGFVFYGRGRTSLTEGQPNVDSHRFL